MQCKVFAPDTQTPPEKTLFIWEWERKADGLHSEEESSFYVRQGTFVALHTWGLQILYRVRTALRRIQPLSLPALPAPLDLPYLVSLPDVLCHALRVLEVVFYLREFQLQASVFRHVSKGSSYCLA